ncbi:rCG28630, isoform CRA_b [Rattus norvegicus]|uniref:RCG28630, isoform CRA_b n=1 Tax=Rattus norvegicus TaxID=10116 RepID=A6HVT7_RAT|nr:rCG28630, isoform CRA_b [Rattus norvegicus]
MKSSSSEPPPVLATSSVKGSSARNEEQCSELQPTYRELLDCPVVFPIIDEALIEFTTFLLSDVISVS